MFDIASGRLRIGSAAAAPESLPEVDFAGGKLRLGELAPGSDAARRLGDFASPRRLQLDVESPDGTRLGLPLVDSSGADRRVGESAPLTLDGVRWWCSAEIDASRLRVLVEAARRGARGRRAAIGSVVAARRVSCSRSKARRPTTCSR